MKELSIEEKAKAYDEAIERARLYKGLQAEMSVVFPELKKESEDEKIRKEIIHLVTKSHEQGGYALHKDEAEEMLAWLEKQCEKELVTCPICGWEFAIG